VGRLGAQLGLDVDLRRGDRAGRRRADGQGAAGRVGRTWARPAALRPVAVRRCRPAAPGRTRRRARLPGVLVPPTPGCSRPRAAGGTGDRRPGPFPPAPRRGDRCRCAAGRLGRAGRGAEADLRRRGSSPRRCDAQRRPALPRAGLRARGPDPTGGDPSPSALVDAFHDAHRERYGYDQRGEEVELVTLRAVPRAPRRACPCPASRVAGTRTRPWRAARSWSTAATVRPRCSIGVRARGRSGGRRAGGRRRARRHRVGRGVADGRGRRPRVLHLTARGGARPADADGRTR
jgi:hypothetical protein